MQSLPKDIYSVAGVRSVDRAAIETAGIPGYELMSRAAGAALREIRLFFPRARRWQILCGSGNNAGDGYVLARLAREAGIVPRVAALSDPVNLRGDAAQAFADFRDAGGAAELWRGSLDDGIDLVVDALLGSGLCRDIAGDYANAVAAANQHPAPVVALDIPTGIDGDSGATLGTAIQADMTISFVGLTSGLFLGDGIAAAGRLRCDALSIPDDCFDAAAVVLRRIDDFDMERCLPVRRRDAHKGHFGRVLVIGGGPGMPGAVRLCGEAALRSGAGRVSVATDPGHAREIPIARPELMVHGVAGAGELAPLLARADVIAFGPGLGQTAWAQSLFDAVMASRLPAVWDADALNLLAARGGIKTLAGQPGMRVMTPHPGEAASLLGCRGEQVQSDRLRALHALQQLSNSIVVLKGAATLVSSHTETPCVSSSGNPGMATAGMGDVLTGIIAGLIAQGLSPADAAMVGVEAHARAGDLAAAKGERGVLASDVLNNLQSVINPVPGA